MKYLIFVLLSFLFSEEFNYNKEFKKKKFLILNNGFQISGIKPEDFIISNVSPVYSISGGLWFNKEIALQIGYTGLYFHTISDNDKHYYNYTHGSVLLNLSEIINFTEYEQFFSFIIESGAGYFYNKYYRRPNICINYGILITANIKDKIQLCTKFSSIIGWDIYQNNEDILPSVGLGIIYSIE